MNCMVFWDRRQGGSGREREEEEGTLALIYSGHLYLTSSQVLLSMAPGQVGMCVPTGVIHRHI